jgi:hypothetical protein
MPRILSKAAAILVFTLAGCGSVATQGDSMAALFNGRDFSGWELVAMPAAPIEGALSYRPDGSVVISGNPVSFIATTGEYENYRLHVEWRWTEKAGNAGVLLHIASGPKDRAWPLSLQVQTKNTAAGDLLPMAGASFAEPLTTAPGANPQIRAKQGADSEKPVGQWNSADIVSRDGTVEVSINGVLQNRISGAQPKRGRIGFQLEGTPYEVRNVNLTRL